MHEAEMVKDLAFPLQEYNRRVTRARHQMAETGVDALIIATGPNLTYLSGYPSPTRGSARPFILVLPLEFEPALIVQNGRQFEAQRYSWIDDLRTYSHLSRAPVALIASVLDGMGLTKAIIGMELGFEQCLDIPFLDFLQLRESMPGADFVDAADILWNLRMVKSGLEASLIREACAITSRCYEECLPQIVSGMTEVDVHNMLASKAYELGGAGFFAIITSGEGSYDLVSKGPTARTLQPGDMVWIDSGCSVSGYWSDFGRAAVLGNPTAEQLHAQRTIHQITMLGVEMVKPGVRTFEIAQACNAELAKIDFTITSCISDLASRIGHGVGLSVTELPHVSELDDTVLQPGMVITIEPGVATLYGTFHVEENVLVTERGYELLSTAGRDLWCV
jgi:Xaa-Pro dipeptidase